MKTEQELEKIIDHELHRLPDPQAPETLIPKVLKAIQALETVPWYRRPWFDWPVNWQILSAIAIVILISVFELCIQQSGLTGRIAREIKDTIVSLESITHTMLIFWRLLIRPCAFYLLLFASGLLMFCIAIGSVAKKVMLPLKEVESI